MLRMMTMALLLSACAPEPDPVEGGADLKLTAWRVDVSAFPGHRELDCFAQSVRDGDSLRIEGVLTSHPSIPERGYDCEPIASAQPAKVLTCYGDNGDVLTFVDDPPGGVDRVIQSAQTDSGLCVTTHPIVISVTP